MSQHQIYEFLSLDHPLSKQQQAELRAISSRAQITSTRFFNEYEWGDLDGEPRRMLATYFDAFLYLANTGSRWLMFKLPLALIDAEIVDDYCDGELVTLTRVNDEHALLSLQSCREDDQSIETYREHVQSLSELIHIREQIIQGDYRALFMFYVHHLQHHPDANELERGPIIPTDLDRHDSALEKFTALFGIDDDLISAAASLLSKHQKDAHRAPDREREAFIATLTDDQKNALLLAVMTSPDEARHTLLAKFRQYASPRDAASPRLNPQTVTQLLNTSRSIKKERLRKHQSGSRTHGE